MCLDVVAIQMSKMNDRCVIIVWLAAVHEISNVTAFIEYKHSFTEMRC